MRRAKLRRMPGTPHSRRVFLRSSLAFSAVTALGGYARQAARTVDGGVMAPKHPELIVRSPNPLDLETPVHLLDSWVTPIDRFYVRGHLYMPEIDMKGWRLRVGGQVEKALELSLDDLKKLERATEVVTMECAGSGRAFYQPRVAGVQWGNGAVGTARWTGARLADVLKKAGLKSTGRHVAADGADMPMGKVPDFVRSVPIEKCLHPSTLLAYEMNGQPIPLQHGYPLRLIVPGWEGAASVKWVVNLNVQEKEAEGFFMKTAYRYPTRPVAPGEAVDAADMLPLTSLDVKSIVTGPRTNSSFASGAPVVIEGAAWAGEKDIRSVEVSTDAGRTWRPASLENDRAPFAWRRFSAAWQAPGQRGSYVLMSRATDTSGRVQPIVPQWNPSGYLWNIVDHVRIFVGQPGPAQAPVAALSPQLPAGPARALAERACLPCHDATLIAQQRLDPGRWAREVDKMINWGAGVKAEEREVLIRYFAEHYR